MINKAIKYSTTQFKYTSLTLLENRCILQLNGADCYSLLQGITTNDLKKLERNKQCIYTNFLNTQGRILSDAFLIRPEQFINKQWQFVKDELWLDIDYDLKNRLVPHLKKFLIRKKVEIVDISAQIKVLALYSDLMRHKEELGDQVPQFEQKVPLDIEEGTYRNMCFSDPRKDQMGCRLITNDPEVQMDETMIKRAGERVYEAYRLRQGILEGQELENKLPFSCNMDFYNAICMSKGCYVGQELVSRSYHTGVIRKRIMPFVIIENDIEGGFTELELNYPDISGTEITNKEQSFGKIIKNCGNFGVAEVRYLEMDLSQRFKAGNHTIEFCMEPYLNQRIDSYKELLQNR